MGVATNTFICTYTPKTTRLAHSVTIPTPRCRRPTSDKDSAATSFHKNIHHVALQGEQTGKAGKFGFHQVANVDQTPLPFCFADGPTYAVTGDNRLGSRLWIWAGEEAMYCPDYLLCRLQGQSQATVNF